MMRSRTIVLRWRLKHEQPSNEVVNYAFVDGARFGVLTGRVVVKIVRSSEMAKTTKICPATMSLICVDGFHSGSV